jgi:hypothetical protein
MNDPPDANECTPVHVPPAMTPGADGDPSPQLIEHVCESFEPASVYGHDTGTG